MGWESYDVVRFYLGVAKLNSAYNSLIVGPRGFGCQANLQEIMSWESSDVVRFVFWPCLHGQMRIAKLKSAYNSLIIGPRGLGCETHI